MWIKVTVILHVKKKSLPTVIIFLTFPLPIVKYKRICVISMSLMYLAFLSFNINKQQQHKQKQQQQPQQQQQRLLPRLLQQQQQQQWLLQQQQQHWTEDEQFLYYTIVWLKRVVSCIFCGFRASYHFLLYYNDKNRWSVAVIHSRLTYPVLSFEWNIRHRLQFDIVLKTSYTWSAILVVSLPI